MDESFDLDPSMVAHYGEGREQERLHTISRLEFVRTQEILARYLPPAPARVLDVGGGAGVHALPLVDQGHDVVLVDPLELHVEQALAAGVRNAFVGDARGLQYANDEFDAVLLLGPLYHLTDRADRLRALGEARRVARPGGVVLAAAISRFASTNSGLLFGFLADPQFEGIVALDVAIGLHENPTQHPGWFTTAYFHRPDEFAEEIAASGLKLAALLAVEGPGAFLADVDDWLDDDERREVLLRAVRRVESEPSLLGASAHLIGVGRVPGAS